MFNVCVQLVNPQKRRQLELRRAFERGEEVSEAVPTLNLKDNERLLVLLCFRKVGCISHVCWGRQGNKAASGLTRLNFERITEINSIDISALAGDERFEEVLSFFAPSTNFWGEDRAEKLVEVLRSNFADIDKFVGESIADYAIIDALTDQQRKTIRLENDATEMALRMANMVSRHTYVWSPTKQSQSEVTSFFSGLQPHHLLEDDIVRWDLERVPGFQVMQAFPYGHYILEAAGEKLHMFHANKNKLENALGVDLIYFNEAQRTFVFVQYKGAEQAGGTDIFRFPDTQLQEELARMDAVWSALGDEAAASPVNYRLIANPFFLKICPRDEFNPDQHEQIKGMIIPRDYWSLIEADTSEMFQGEKGGRFLSFKNCPKYLDNTMFVSFMQEGWIGTGADLSKAFEGIISEIINGGHSVILAAKLKAKGIEGVSAAQGRTRRRAVRKSPKRRGSKRAKRKGR